MQIWCLWCVWNNVLKPAVQSVRGSPPHHIIHCDLVSVCRLNVHLLQQKEQKNKQKKTDGINLTNTQKTTTCHTSCTDALEPIVQPPPVVYFFVCGQHEVNGSGSLHLETPCRNNKVILLKARFALLGKLCTPLIEILSPPPPLLSLLPWDSRTYAHKHTAGQRWD